MVVSSGWDDYLFKNHRLVAVDPWTTEQELGLLSVYTKMGTYGIFHRGPKLGGSGALKNLANEGETSASDHRNKLEDVRSAFRSSSRPEMITSLQSSTKISASMLKIVMGDDSSDKSFIVKVDNVKSESIDLDRLTSLVNEGHWNPDLSSPQLPKKWDHVLWVVTEIVYAKGLTIGENSKAVAKAGIRPALLVPLTGLPIDVEGRFELLETTDNTKVFRAVGNNRFPIGFKAMRLEFGKEGNLLRPGGIKTNLGGKRPQLRADTDDWLNPDKDPDRHMGELFKQESGKQESFSIVVDEQDPASPPMGET